MRKKPERTNNLLAFAKGKGIKREPRFYLVIEKDGIKTCSQPGWPEEVQEYDIVINMHVYTDAEIEAYHKRIGFKP